MKLQDPVHLALFTCTKCCHRPRTQLKSMVILHQEAGEKHAPELMSTFSAIIESSPFKTGKANA